MLFYVLSVYVALRDKDDRKLMFCLECNWRSVRSNPVLYHIASSLERNDHANAFYECRRCCRGAGSSCRRIRQGATSYYIIQDVKTKKCTVVDKKPVATEATVVGPDGVVYKTKTEAETAMKTVKVCTSA